MDIQYKYDTKTLKFEGTCKNIVLCSAFEVISLKQTVITVSFFFLVSIMETTAQKPTTRYFKKYRERNQGMPLQKNKNNQIAKQEIKRSRKE